MIKYVLNAKQMKDVDRYSIEKMQVPSLVLMERAALGVCEVISGIYEKPRKVICVCSTGNNGADGLAAARILHLRGWNTAVCIVEKDRSRTEEFETQLAICRNIGIPIGTTYEYGEYDVIVDAIFGIGLSRTVEGGFFKAIEAINASGKRVVSVDIPSGINPSNAQVMGIAVRAEHTVTFGYEKIGLLLYPGAEYAGRVHLMEDVGFVPQKDVCGEYAFTVRKDDITGYLPARAPYSNKGTYGKVLTVAGSQKMAGAAYFSAAAAYRTGTGLVKVITHSKNRDVIMQRLPEAVIDFYDDMTEAEAKLLLKWKSAMVIGPGLSTDEKAQRITELFLEKGRTEENRNIVVDADSLNIVAGRQAFPLLEGTIITPHIGEMARLSGRSVEWIQKNPVETAADFAGKNKCICVLKDARTIVTDGKRIYINVTGNNGMATGGCGDVLTGIIAGLLAQGMKQYDAAWLAVCIHGAAGDLAAGRRGQRAMLATDILESIGAILSGQE